MSQHLPAIAAKLAPARAVIDFINDNLDIHELACYPDDMECVAAFKGCEPSAGLDDVSTLAANAFCAAYDHLPEGYDITLEDKRFVIVRQTPEEIAELARAEEAELDFSNVAGLDKEYVCFRFEPAAMVEFDASGNPKACYGYQTMWGVEGSPDINQGTRDCIRRTMARAVATSIENVTPITVEEYLAAGGKLEEDA